LTFVLSSSDRVFAQPAPHNPVFGKPNPLRDGRVKDGAFMNPTTIIPDWKAGVWHLDALVFVMAALIKATSSSRQLWADFSDEIMPTQSIARA